jgi:hypothetical protein
MKFATHAAAMAGLMSAAALPGSVAAVTFELGRGHFVVQMDDTIDTFRVVALDIPGHCTPPLAALDKGDGTYEIHAGDPHCHGEPYGEPYGELRVNPAWSRSLNVNMAAGQIDFAGSAVRRLASIHARVRAGDIFGLPGVQRRWLFGAVLDARLQPEGVTLRTELGAGQILLDADVPH